MRLYLLIVLSAVCTLHTMAQRSLKAVVKDSEDSIALQGATIDCLVNNTSKQKTITNSKGEFFLELPKTDNVILKITFVGYDSYMVSLNEQQRGKFDLGDIYLNPAVTSLHNVTVTARAKTIDRTLIFPQKNDVKVSDDFFTLLRVMNLRNLHIDMLNKKANIDGKSVLWKVNGIPKDENEISVIKPKDVLRIDYSDRPSAREQDRGYGGIINIILKKNDNGGNLSLTGTTALTTGFVNGAVVVGYTKDKHNFSLNYSNQYRHYTKWREDADYLYVSPAETIERNMIGQESLFGYMNQNLNANYNYAIDNKTALSISLRNPIYYQHNTPTSVYQKNILREINSSYKSYIPSLDIFFGKTFSNKDRLELNVVGTIGLKGKSRYTLTDYQNGMQLSSYRSPADSKRNSLISEIYYMHNLHNQTQLKIGVQNKLGHSKNSYYEPKEYEDRLDENNTYVYAQLNGQLGEKVQYSIGSGIKYNKRNNGISKKEYWRNQSQLRLSYTPSKTWFFKYYGRYYPSMPSLYTMTNVVQAIDDLQMLKGNPYLKSTQNLYNNLLASYSKGAFSSDFALTCENSIHPIFLYLSYDTENKYFLQSYINGKYNMRFDVNYSASLRNLFGFMNIMGSIGHATYWSETDDFSHKLNNLYWELSLQLYYKDLTLSGYVMKPQKTLYNETISREEKSSRIMLMWKQKRLTLTATIYNPFAPQGCDYIDQYLSRYRSGSSKVTIKDNGNMFLLGFSYNVDFGKKSNKPSRNLNNGDYGNTILRP